MCGGTCRSRFAVGVSPDGSMVGTDTARANAIICDPSKGTVNQYNITAASFAGMVPHATSGTTNMKVVQSDGQTVMTWTRGFDNGDPKDAQISASGPTHVIFAVATTNVFGPSPVPHMGEKSVNLAGTPTYDNTVSLMSGLTLNWNVKGSELEFQAVLSSLAW